MTRLMTHAGAQRVSREALRALPAPTVLGPHHKPVPHYALVDGLRNEVHERGYTVSHEEYALAQDGHVLFGVLDLKPIEHALERTGAIEVIDVRPETLDLKEAVDRGLAFGLRNSTNSTLGIKGVAGTKVFVCDNLALSGDLIALMKKNTGGLDLQQALREGFDKFLAHASTLDRNIAMLQAREIRDIEAKEKIFDIFASKILPVRLFDDVEAFYFRPGDEMTDVQPRTLWGLHNAFTRALKLLSPTRAFNANVALGRAFELTA